MDRKGFTLVESILGLFLLGLIGVTTLPIIHSSLIIFKNHNIRLEMMYIGEMTIEKIKAYNIDSESDLYIYDVAVSELIELFNRNNSIEIDLPKKENNEKFSLKIIKDEKLDSLWMLSVYVYHNKEGSNISNVEYLAYLRKK